MLYYKDEYVTLHLGDCLEINDWLSADVLVTDPPYGANWLGWKNKKLLIDNDESTAVRDQALTQWDCQKPSLVFGKWSEPKPIGTKAVLIWEKGNHTGVGDLRLPWRPSTEEIYVLGKWPERESLGRGGGGRVSNVLSVMATAKLSPEQGRLHPTEKPIKLMTDLLSRMPPGVVADPFAGSGATLLAARDLGRKAVGVELNEEYCETIAKRLSQGTIF